jgi:hypothetical protein
MVQRRLTTEVSMATLQQIQAAMTGFPRALTWQNYRSVPNSPRPPAAAFTSASWAMSGWSVRPVDGEYRVQGARMTVAFNPTASWAIPSARSSADLLQHEQGHFDITGLIARDLIGNVLDLSLDVDVVASLRDAGHTQTEHLRYVTRRFQTLIEGLARDAAALGARLQTNPATQADGLYDVQTNHSQNLAGQKTWNSRLQRIKAGNTSFALCLQLEGVI